MTGRQRGAPDLDGQRAFYARGAHAHLRPGANDPYAAKLAGRLASQLGMRPSDRVLEVGAGFGRFTFHLLAHCRSVVAADVSERTLGELDLTRRERGIPEERCRIQVADVDALAPADLAEPVDHVVGFFLLHHLPDFHRSIGRLARLLPAGGGLGFLEPNRRNPLFLAQVLVCRDMDWRSERGMFRLRRAQVEQAYRDAGLAGVETTTLGMFPPQIANRFALARRLEAAIETVPFASAWLPFLLMTARRPDTR
jgi:ubiquinone/menaquinone biosynthesis C-methylase UbiE